MLKEIINLQTKLELANNNNKLIRNKKNYLKINIKRIKYF